MSLIKLFYKPKLCGYINVEAQFVIISPWWTLPTLASQRNSSFTAADSNVAQELGLGYSENLVTLMYGTTVPMSILLIHPKKYQLYQLIKDGHNTMTKIQNKDLKISTF